jgi:hypothetical protein
MSEKSIRERRVARPLFAARPARADDADPLAIDSPLTVYTTMNPALPDEPSLTLNPARASLGIERLGPAHARPSALVPTEILIQTGEEPIE